MTNDEVLTVTKQIIDCWNQHDTDKFLTYCDDKIVWQDTGIPQPYTSKEGARQFFDMWNTAFPDFKLTLQKTIVSQDCIAVECEFSGTNSGPMKMGDAPEMPATNKKVTGNKGSFFAWFKNGKLAEVHSYPDQAGMMMQLGLMHEAHA
jgi:steroid delta-isomerase-like uncharacterized protein